MVNRNKDSDKDILILYNSVEYFIAHFKERDILATRTFREVSFPSRLVKRLFRLMKLSEGYWYGDWKRMLTSTKIIIIFAPLGLKVLKYITKCNRNIRIIYWYWNPTFRVGLPPNGLHNLAEIWSFDPEDCGVVGMNFNTTFYFNDILLANSLIEFDAIFLGNDKGRRAALKELENTLNRNGIKAYFHVVSDKYEDKKNKIKSIPYSEYLEMVSKTKAIVDIIPIGQSGLTLRPMESIFFRKKLITNMLTIVSHDFYNEQNVFIIGKDDEAQLKDFIESPYVELEDFIVKKYDFNSWLERFNI